jgi:uncharacterized protein YfaS (alpha-2-macroglobulin family)
MKRILFFVCAMFFMQAFAYAVGNSYEDYWKEVGKYEEKSLPKSVLEVVEKIYKKAEKEGNCEQKIKALIYKFKQIQKIEEESDYKILSELELEIEKAKSPEKEILHSFIGEIYWDYYSKNRYKIMERSQLEKNDDLDIRTWDVTKLVEKVIFHYLQSLKNTEALKKVMVEEYSILIYSGDKEGQKIRETLYDVIMHKALEFFMNNEASITKPLDTFEIDKKTYFSKSSEFIKENLELKDEFSFKYYAMKILQDLEKNYAHNKEVLSDIVLERLNYVKDHSFIKNSEELYIKALENMIELYSDTNRIGQIKYVLASYYRQKALYGNDIDKNENYNLKAHTLVNDIVLHHSDSKFFNNAHNMKLSIEETYLNLESEDVIVPNNNFMIKLLYRNTEKVHWKLLKYDSKIYEKKYLSSEELVELFAKEDAIQEGNELIKNDGLYNNRTTEILLDGLNVGEYIFIVSDNDSFDMKKGKGTYIKFRVSNFTYLKRESSGKTEFRIFDRTTGEKYPNVEVRVYKEVYSILRNDYILKEIDKFESDEEGYFYLDSKDYKENNLKLRFISETEDIYINDDVGLYVYGSSKYGESKRTFYYTDRSIYRPGQTVYFKGITLGFSGEYNENVRALPDEDLSVEFFDTNYKSVRRIALKTNKYGTISGSFTIPDDVLTGRMRIRGGNGERYFYVEEYKRPNFYVEFEELKEKYKLNDEIVVEGSAKAYAGYNISDAEVKYSIERRSFRPIFTYWNWIIPESHSTQIASGSLITDKEGKFEIQFDAVPDLAVQNQYFNGFEYIVNVDITDITGETRSLSKNIKVADKGAFFGLDLPSTLDRDKGKYTISYNIKNIEGQSLEGKGKIKIYSLKSPDTILKEKIWDSADYPIVAKEEFYKKINGMPYADENHFVNWEKDKEVLEFNFDSKKTKNIVFDKLSKLKLGIYKVEFEGRSGEENFDGEYYFTLYSKTGKEVPYKVPFWFEPVKVVGEPGQKAEILIGTSYKNSTMMYEIENKGKVIKTEFVSLDSNQKLIEIPIEEENRGGFYVSLYFFKDNRAYKKVQKINVPWTNKKLNVTFEKFRDKLKPGQEEKWTLKILDFENKVVDGELALVLYDASLDAIMNHDWDLNIYPQIASKMIWDIDRSYGGGSGGTAGKNIAYYSEYRISYPYLNNFGFDINYQYYSYTRQLFKGAHMLESASFEMDEKMVSKSIEFEDNSMDKEKKSEKKVEEKIRENFNETAFFYPQLVNDKDGKVEVEFTMPDSLTRWKVLGLAHTKDASFGTIENYLVTAKELMVRANSPRFLREGDSIEFSAEVVNGEDKRINGEVELELLNPFTMENITHLFGEIDKIEFELNGNSRKKVSWKLKIPSEIDSVVYRIKAKSGNTSDGEQKLLPILKNSMLVTETMPLSLRANEDKKFEFKSFMTNQSDTLKNYAYTFEFTSNPAWYIVQALPYMMESPYENNESVFSRFYSNSLAKNIIDSSPEIERIFKQWKLKKSSELLSNLEKNQELKSIILENTPWLNEAKNESDRKQKIALYFDRNKINLELEEEKAKLIKNQYSNGSWPWFDGMQGNRYITQYIVIGLSRLHKLGIINLNEDRKLAMSLKKAVEYLDSEIKRDYDRLIENKINLDKNNLTYVTIGYLYARSMLDFMNVAHAEQTAFDYYKNQLIKYRHDYGNNKYMQGMVALTLYRLNKEVEALEVMDSIKEYALYSEEMGMYWKNDEGMYWYQNKISSQTILIEAFDEILGDEKAVEEMKLWLLKQKQTQNWETTKATAEACYAFLLRGKNLLLNTNLPNVTIGEKELDIKNEVEVEDGTGYFKINWTREEIDKKLAEVEIKNNNDGASWGGIYWQYFEKLDKIEGHETNLKVYKKLFVEKVGDRGPYLQEVNEDKELKVGDKVKVRIEIRVDRDMEYVHLKDMRASAFEPENVISSYKWQDGFGYYEATGDSAVSFFIDYLPKGTYIFEYPLRVTHMGEFSNGITTIQSMYAPEFSSHSKGIRVNINE